jgi:hypothetical protein
MQLREPLQRGFALSLQVHDRLFFRLLRAPPFRLVVPGERVGDCGPWLEQQQREIARSKT